jgi:hypothetical protein
MLEPTNGQALSPTQNARPRYTGEPLERIQPKTAGAFTGEILIRTRPKVYRKIVQLLGEGRSDLSIAKQLRVSPSSVKGVRLRESEEIGERKKLIVSLLADTAVLGSERMVQTIGKAGLRDAAIGTGIAVDKMLAMTGQTPPAVGVVIMPSENEREERRAIHDRLDAISRRLAGHTPGALPAIDA